MNAELLNCVFESWSPTIGDPTLMGWFTVLSYLLASLLSGIVLFGRVSDQRSFWLIITVLLILLSVNKQLDLQSALTAIGRCAAKIQGWYGQRQTVQVAFIVAISAFSLLLTFLIAWNVRRGLRSTWLALFGFVFLATFVVVRAAGFHHFDRLINFEAGSIRMNSLFELTGIGMISLNAIFLILARRVRGAQRKKCPNQQNILSNRRSSVEDGD